MISTILEPGTELLHLEDGLPLVHDEPYPAFGVPYTRVGPDDAPVVIVQGGISADARVADDANGGGWWSGIVGPGRAIDTEAYHVISLDYLGGPRTTGERPRRRVTSWDQARLTDELLRRLRIDRVQAFVGASYGGMVGLTFAARARREAGAPKLGSLVVVSAPAEPHPWATAWRSLQRRVLRLGRSLGASDEAVAIARGIGLVTYRTPLEFEARFAVGVSDDGRHAVESYLEARGQAFAERFDLDAYETLSAAIDLHRVDPSEVSVPTTVVGASSDELVRPSELRELARRLPCLRRFVRIDSPYGHDAFLKETARLSPIIERALDEKEESHAVSRG